MFLHFLLLSRNKVCTWGHTNEVDKKICTCIQMCWYIKPYSFILKLLWMFAIRDFFSNGLVAKPSQRGGWPIKSVGLDLTTYFSQSNCRFGAGTGLTILEKKVSFQNYVHWRRHQFSYNIFSAHKLQIRGNKLSTRALTLTKKLKDCSLMSFQSWAGFGSTKINRAPLVPYFFFFSFFCEQNSDEIESSAWLL